MHMTSQKGAPVVLGVKRGTPRAPSPSMQSEGKPLHATPPSWPGCAHWLREWATMRSASKTCARSATSLDPQHGVVVMETWRQCIRSIPGVPPKKQIACFSLLWYSKILHILISSDKALSSEKNDTKIIWFGLVVLILQPFLETQSFFNFGKSARAIYGGYSCP